MPNPGESQSQQLEFKRRRLPSDASFFLLMLLLNSFPFSLFALQMYSSASSANKARDASLRRLDS